MKKSILSIVAAATLMTGFASVPTAAAAQYYDHGGYEDRRDDRYGDRYERRHDRREYRRDYRRDHRRDYRRGDYYRGGYDRGYNNGGYYNGGGYRDDNRYRGCSDGTGGTIIGGVAGALAGREIAGRRGDRTAGAIIGGAIGALAGRAIDRSDNRCR